MGGFHQGVHQAFDRNRRSMMEHEGQSPSWSRRQGRRDKMVELVETMLKLHRDSSRLTADSLRLAAHLCWTCGGTQLE